MPNALRPYLTSFYSLAWVSAARQRDDVDADDYKAFGQLLNAVVFRGTLTLPSPWTYRVPFALQ